MGDQPDMVGVREDRTDRGAVQVLHAAEVERQNPAARGGFGDGRGECVVERVDVAEVDLPCRGQTPVSRRWTARCRESARWASGDPRGQVNCGSAAFRVDGDVVHQRSHERDTPTAVEVGGRLRRLPRAGVGDRQPHLVCAARSRAAGSRRPACLGGRVRWRWRQPPRRR